MRVTRIWCILAGLVGIVAGRAFGQEAPGAERPNIVFIMADDQRHDLLGCAGHPILQTPHVDALAARGVRFTNMFVTTSICAASRASILTGLHERTHQFTFGTPPLKSTLSQQSYPALLREAGYRTGFVGKLGVKLEAGELDRMFDSATILSRNPYFKTQPDGSRQHITEMAGDLAVQFLRESASGPFCLSVSFNAPHAEDSDKEDHYPWPPSADGLYDDVKMPLPVLGDPEIFAAQPEFLRNSFNRERWYWRWDTPEKYQKNVRAYFRMISGVDHVVGRIIAELESQGVADNTVVIYTADNGYYLGERGFAGKWSHYEESLRVPLVIHDPHRTVGNSRLVEAMTLNIDIPATILDLAGVNVPAAYQGSSLRPWLAGETPDAWREDFFCEHLMEIGTRIPKYEGVRGKRYVYARYFEQEPTYEFLHDLQTDPQQLKSFANDPDYAEILAATRQRCDELKQQYEAAVIESGSP